MTPTDEAFALTGLTSRGGLSNWVFFCFPKESILVDVGVTPALKAGALAGALAELEVVGEIISERATYGPHKGRGQGLYAWAAELQTKAKNMVRCRNEDLRVRLHRRALAHQLYVTVPGAEYAFAMMNRDEAERVTPLFERRLGARFEVSSTPVFDFFQRHASFLIK